MFFNDVLCNVFQTYGLWDYTLRYGLRASGFQPFVGVPKARYNPLPTANGLRKQPDEVDASRFTDVDPMRSAASAGFAQSATRLNSHMKENAAP